MKKKIHVFVSYARANQELARRFLRSFREQTAPSKQYQYVFWRDGDILVGENWHEEIQKALDKCHLGLVLVSPAFLGSQNIETHELPNLVNELKKLVIPVMLQPIDMERHDLKGLGSKQIFQLKRPRFAEAKSYYECTRTQRDQFALTLFGQVEARLDTMTTKSTIPVLMANFKRRRR